jgi:hypothetical protein
MLKQKENWKIEFEKRFVSKNQLTGGIYIYDKSPTKKELEFFISKLLKEEKQKWNREAMHIAWDRKWIDKLKREWIKDLKQGKICIGCGRKKESNLSDWCGKCLEEN